jgi:hypothetical protein
LGLSFLGNFIMPRTTRASKRAAAAKTEEDDKAAPASTNNKKKQDDRGISFGAAGGYDDAYNDAGDDGGEYVAELPTPEEERKLMGEDVRAREAEEELDEGRAASSHPSTLAASKAKV